MPNTRYFFLLVPQPIPAQPIFSSDTWRTASGLEDNKRSGNQIPTTIKMVAGKTSIAEELLQSISLHQMHAIPAYLSESDATTIEAFAKSELLLTYVLDTQNLYWPCSMFTICEGWDPGTVWYSSCETEAHWGSAHWNLRTIECDRDVTHVHPLVCKANRARNLLSRIVK